jgi:hypothetical protein
LVPLGHKSIAPILCYQLAFAHPLRLSLELIVLTKDTNVGLCSIRQARLAELTQSNYTIGSKMVQLYLKCFQNLAKETSSGEAKAAKKKIPEDYNISSLWPDNSSPCRGFALASPKTPNFCSSSIISSS